MTEENVTQENISEESVSLDEISPGEKPEDIPCEADSGTTENTEAASENKEASDKEAPDKEASDKEAPDKEASKEEEDLKTQFLRLSADFQNYRRRTEAEKSDIYAYANEKILLQILEVIDNFERAMASAPDDDKFADGMRLILKQLNEVLSRNNVSEIEAEGKAFDPAFHNAVMTEKAEGTESGTVTKVLQKGYLLNSKVIRPSMVAVSE